MDIDKQDNTLIIYHTPGGGFLSITILFIGLIIFLNIIFYTFDKYREFLLFSTDIPNGFVLTAAIVGAYVSRAFCRRTEIDRASGDIVIEEMGPMECEVIRVRMSDVRAIRRRLILFDLGRVLELVMTDGERRPLYTALWWTDTSRQAGEIAAFLNVPFVTGRNKRQA